jgi:hypothetical protein
VIPATQLQSQQFVLIQQDQYVAATSTNRSLKTVLFTLEITADATVSTMLENAPLRESATGEGASWPPHKGSNI